MIKDALIIRILLYDKVVRVTSTMRDCTNPATKIVTLIVALECIATHDLV